jgi:hypothetical protein
MLTSFASRRIVSTFRQTRRNMSVEDIFEKKNTIKDVRKKFYSDPTPGDLVIILLKYIFNYKL